MSSNGWDFPFLSQFLPLSFARVHQGTAHHQILYRIRARNLSYSLLSCMIVLVTKSEQNIIHGRNESQLLSIPRFEVTSLKYCKLRVESGNESVLLVVRVVTLIMMLSLLF